MYYMHRGLLAQRKRVRIHVASQYCPPNSAAIAFFSCGNPPVRMDLHAMTCTLYLINSFDSRDGINLFNSNPNVELYIFLE
jgi:hypothetical protein